MITTLVKLLFKNQIVANCVFFEIICLLVYPPFSALTLSFSTIRLIIGVSVYVIHSWNLSLERFILFSVFPSIFGLRAYLNFLSSSFLIFKMPKTVRLKKIGFEITFKSIKPKQMNK